MGSTARDAQGQAKWGYGQGRASWKGLAEFSGGPWHRPTSLRLCPQPEKEATGHLCVVLFPQPRPPSHSVAKNENGVSCSGWVGGRVSFTQIHRAVSGTCVPGTFRAGWRKEPVSELPIMEPGFSKALTSPFSPQGSRGITGYYVQPLRHRALSAQLSPGSAHFFMSNAIFPR